MKRHAAPVSSLYRGQLPELRGLLERSIDKGCSNAVANRPVELFFRADDIGVYSDNFAQMISLFRQYQFSLCLAVVPSWLTPRRFQDLLTVTSQDTALWCWHQHGRLHRNYEISGKKQEFGPARGYSEVKAHLQAGQTRLASILGAQFQPFFTPPWNRCTRETAIALKKLGFKALSRSRNASPDVTDILPDIQINVDLHTRKEPTPAKALTALLLELETGFASGRCGIMLHHQRMNDRAFALLDLLLLVLTTYKNINCLTFKQIVSTES